MNTFSIKEIVELVDMIDADSNNINQYAIVFTKNSYGVYKNEAFEKIRNPDINDEQALGIFQRILHFLAPKVCIDHFYDFTLNKPLNTMPLYINDKDNYGLIAKWRLKIGK